MLHLTCRLTTNAATSIAAADTSQHLARERQRRRALPAPAFPSLATAAARVRLIHTRSHSIGGRRPKAWRVSRRFCSSCFALCMRDEWWRSFSLLLRVLLPFECVLRDHYYLLDSYSLNERTHMSIFHCSSSSNAAIFRCAFIFLWQRFCQQLVLHLNVSSQLIAL